MDWPNSFQGCRGQKQSPVLLPARGAAADALGQPDAKSSFKYGTLSNAQVVNNGHTLQVPLPASYQSDVKIPVKGEHAECRLTKQLASTFVRVLQGLQSEVLQGLGLACLKSG